MAGRSRDTKARLDKRGRRAGGPMSTIAEVTVIEPKPKTVSRFVWLAVALCAATMFVEGYDAQLMGYVVPGIAREWGVAPPSLTPALAFGLVGMALGAFFIG